MVADVLFQGVIQTAMVRWQIVERNIASNYTLANKDFTIPTLANVVGIRQSHGTMELRRWWSREQRLL